MTTIMTVRMRIMVMMDDGCDTGDDVDDHDDYYQQRKILLSVAIYL